ncbi:hypothetical protein SAMN05216474_2254 [Lishizhenia tianjinensis]|uniref:CarboxypepD_reg-like domain-containing protein n=1 Tax=Lishizhenia tianjinensis TaxID=477690 RepID=A0A1I7AN75_9FLAO|nr:hypothetical protein [Lishizhenia tianjinensis]SFT76409.1 hypothetical protein SAMN05216474_2254 [Lishizhenia tianjinensis]
MRHFILIFCLVATASVWGQASSDTTKTTTPKDTTEHLVQLSGIVVSWDSLENIAYAAIYNKTTDRGVISDYYGFFSTVTRPGDTLLFSVYGFKTSAYIVPDTLTMDNYNMIHIMNPDTIEFAPVDIYPWPSREDFARAFVEMDPYDDALKKAQRQLSGEALAFVAAKLPTDASLSYNIEQQAQQTRLYRDMGMAQPNNLLNPVAWSNFVKAWKAGELKRE